jgi:hypothetical protein
LPTNTKAFFVEIMLFSDVLTWNFFFFSSIKAENNKNVDFLIGVLEQEYRTVNVNAEP